MSGEAPGKGPHAFRTIAEVSDLLDVAQHVLRFWEGKFPQLKPMKRAGGRRLYRPEDIALLRGIQLMLVEDGYSIKGVQKVLRDQGVAHVRMRGGGSGLGGGEDAPRGRAPPAAIAPAEIEPMVAPRGPARPDSHLESRPEPGADETRRADLGPLFEERARPSAAAGVALRRALARLEQARAALDRVAPRGGGRA